MVRNYQRKTERADISEEAVQRAIEDVRNGNQSIRQAADFHGLKKSMLHKRLMKIPEGDIDIDVPLTSGSSKYSTRHVFSSEEETLLEGYLIRCSKINYGLTYKQLRDFAYRYALKLDKKLPRGWEEKKTAGIDWVKGFMKRHPQLSLRKPENTSLARNMSFNKHNVGTFFKNLKNVMDKYKFLESRVLNVDESGVTTVLQSPRVVAPTGAKQVGQCVSAERGELVTFCGIVTASGNAVPPVYVYPRVNFKDHFIYGAPSCSKGFASRSGWMTQEIFLEVIKHIKEHTSATKENPILVILDNHESHISLDTIIYCKDNGIILLTFPPHTSHRLQPLDVAVFGPFKNGCRSAFNSWLAENPGKSISIYDIAKLTAKAFDEAFSRKNILAGFKKTGIFPYDSSVFKEEDFLASVPTDQPEEPIEQPTDQGENHDVDVDKPTTTEDQTCNENTTQENSTAGCSFSPKPSSVKPSFPTPEQIRPFPKAEPRKKSGKGRKKGKCCVLTDTPEKNRIEAETLARKIKVEKVCKRNIINPLKSLKPKKRSKRERGSDTESYQSEDLCDDELSPWEESLASDSENEDQPCQLDFGRVEKMDFVLVKLANKKLTKHFVAQVNEEISITEIKVSFLKKRIIGLGLQSITFVEPDIPDVSVITINELVCKLPQPNIVGSTSRAVNVFRFKFNFKKYNMG